VPAEGKFALEPDLLSEPAVRRAGGIFTRGPNANAGSLLILVRQTSVLRTATFESKTDAIKSETDIQKRLDESANVLTEIMETPDKGIPTNVLPTQSASLWFRPCFTSP
jgi:hypothetical protein